MDDKALEARLVELMKTAQVPGMSICVVRDGVQDRGAFGVRNAETKEPIDDDTVFEAASLSKPIVACAVMQLIRAGDLGLDEPLARYIGPLVPDDPASATITARHVLSHTTGLPNWRRDEFPLRTYFSPGTRFSYSGEGFVYLQTAIEHITGESLDALVAQLVLQPLGMHRSSLVWRDSFDENAASGHSMEGSVVPKFKPDRPNAAYSLHSTASDYCRFVTALMDNTKFVERAGSLWLKPQISTPEGRFEALDYTPPATETSVAWGLGWGLEPDSGAMFHWGANWGAKAFIMAIPDKRRAFVAFMNSDNGLNAVPGIVDHIMPGEHPALAWLGLSQEAT